MKDLKLSIRRTHHLYSSSQKSGDVFVPFHPVQTALHCSCYIAVLFLFHMHMRTIGNDGCGLATFKNGKPARSLAD